MGSQSLLNFPDISIQMEDNMMLFSYDRKAYMVKLKLHAPGMKIREMVCKIVVLVSNMDPCLFMSNFFCGICV